jgi:hypothetical protein
MKGPVLIVLGVMLAGMGVAQANEPSSEKHRGPFEFSCRFVNNANKDKATAQQCRVWAKVCEFDEERGGRDIMSGEERRRCEDRLAVECDGQPVYNDEARHTSFGDFQFISGHGGNPVLKYVAKDRRPMHRDDNFVISAWLKVNGSTLEGFCSVEEKDRRPAL